MKTKYIIIASVIAGLSIMNTGCDKNFQEINIDPEHITSNTMDYNYLLTAAELITSGNSDGNAYETWRNNLIYASCMIQHLSSTAGYWGGDKYTYNAGYNSAYWDQQYPNSIRNIVEVVNNTTEDTALSRLHNIARIFKVFMFQRMTDMYGDCPYSEAGLGYIKGITNPKYDKQKDIYMDMLNELQDAAQKLNGSGINHVGSADVIYQGDVNKWKKFAYSEMVRLAMRMTKVDPANAEKWVKTAVQGGVMESNEDNALLRHDAGHSWDPISNPNGWILDGQDPTNGHVSKTFISYLKNMNDPRLIWIATVCDNPGNTSEKGDTSWAKQLGQPNGYDVSSGPRDISNAPNWPGDQSNYSVVNRYTFSRLDAPTFFLTYSETQLLLAEAAQRGWTNGSATDYYNKGVKAAILQINQTGGALTEAQADKYLAAHPYNPAKGLEMINTQYWVATFMDEYEAWANWRRSGYPELTPVEPYPGNVTNGTIPRRFTYPVTEAATNSENYQAAVAGMNNGDKMNSRVWWDVEK